MPKRRAPAPSQQGDIAILLTFSTQEWRRGAKRRLPTDDDLELCNMAIGEDIAGAQSPFARLLDELDDDDSPFFSHSAALGDGKLWPRASAAPHGQGFFSSEAVESFYTESLPQRDLPAPATEQPAKPEQSAPPLTPPDFGALRQELAASRSLDDLRRLRRRYALAIHPDRVAPLDRRQAEKFMAEVNAAIDRAIRQRRDAAPHA